MRVWKSKVVFSALLCVVSTVVAAQQPTPKAAKTPLTFTQKVDVGNTGAKRLCTETVNAQRSYLLSKGTSPAFKDMAGAMISWEEKIAQGNELFGSSDNTVSRIVQSFRQHVIDDTKQRDQFERAVKQLQEKLITDTYLLFRESGRKLSAFPQQYPDFGLKETAFRDEFSPLFGRAAQLAKSDWFRELAVNTGVFVSGNLARQVAEDTGYVERDSWSALLFELAADAVAQAVVDEVHDPAGDIGKRLKSDYDAICSRMIDGSGGFAEVCKYITDQHIQFRMELLGLKQKGNR